MTGRLFDNTLNDCDLIALNGYVMGSWQVDSIDKSKMLAAISRINTKHPEIYLSRLQLLLEAGIKNFKIPHFEPVEGFFMNDLLYGTTWECGSLKIDNDYVKTLRNMTINVGGFAEISQEMGFANWKNIKLTCESMWLNPTSMCYDFRFLLTNNITINTDRLFFKRFDRKWDIKSPSGLSEFLDKLGLYDECAISTFKETKIVFGNDLVIINKSMMDDIDIARYDESLEVVCSDLYNIYTCMHIKNA